MFKSNILFTTRVLVVKKKFNFKSTLEGCNQNLVVNKILNLHILYLHTTLKNIKIITIIKIKLVFI